MEITGAGSGYTIENYCILDKDYCSDIKNEDIKLEAEKSNINLTIWNSKEIENYMIHPTVICRLVKDNSNQTVSEQEIRDMINEILEDNKQRIINHFGSKILEENKGLDFATVNNKANKIVNQYWNSLEHKIQICPGKDILKQIRTKIQEKYQISFSDIKLAKSFRKSEIPDDIIRFLNTLYH